jgi:hypothetical protein
MRANSKVLYGVQFPSVCPSLRRIDSQVLLSGWTLEMEAGTEELEQNGAVNNRHLVAGSHFFSRKVYG